MFHYVQKHLIESIKASVIQIFRYTQILLIRVYLFKIAKVRKHSKLLLKESKIKLVDKFLLSLFFIIFAMLYKW